MFRLEPNSIINMLTLRYDPSQEPLLPKLMPEHVRNVRNISIEELTKVLKDVIKEKLASHKRIALALSNGVDSTLLLILIRELFPEMKIECICGILDKNEECKCASEIAAKFNANFHTIDFDEINVLEELPLQLSIVKEPRWNLYFYHIIKEATKYSNVLITGDGGDELFGGYTFRYLKFLNLLNNKDSWREKAILYLDCHERDFVPDQHNLFASRIKFSWDEILKLFKVYFDNDLEPLQQVFLADFNGKLLFDFIPTTTKLYKYFNVIGIAPFLDNKIISLAMSINPILKFNKDDSKGKIILREILSCYNTSLNNNKLGFSLNTINVFRNNQDIFKYYLEDARIVKDEWINEEWLKKARRIIEESYDVRYVNKMFSLLAFEIWYRLFITNELTANIKL